MSVWYSSFYSCLSYISTILSCGKGEMKQKTVEIIGRSSNISGRRLQLPVQVALELMMLIGSCNSTATVTNSFLDRRQHMIKLNFYVLRGHPYTQFMYNTFALTLFDRTIFIL